MNDLNVNDLNPTPAHEQPSDSGSNLTVEFLAWLYGSEHLFHSPTGMVYPLVVQPIDAIAPNQLLGNLSQEHRSFPQSSWLLEEMKQSNSYLWNGKTYALQSLETTTAGYRLHCVLGSYFDTVNTCTILEVELHRAITALPSTASHAERYDAMPLRQALHGDRRGTAALADAWSSRERSAAVAIACLFVVETGEDSLYFVRQRSTNLADGGGQYHIVPSMVFQPTSADPWDPNDYNLENTILREVAEELFSREECDRKLNTYPEIADLQEQLRTGGATLTVSGIAMDLLCLRPEILVVLHVRNPDWFAKHGSGLSFSHHEYVTDRPEQDSWRSTQDDRPFHPGGEFDPHRCIATGAASTILGLARIRISPGQSSPVSPVQQSPF